MKENPRMPKILAAMVAACALTVLDPASGHAATATSPGGSATYQCQANGDVQAEPTPVTFALTGQPTTVRAGDTLALGGTLRMTLADSEVQRSRLLLARHVQVDATDFVIDVKAGGETFSLRPSEVVGTATAVGSPFELTADLTYPEVVVPRTATGAVTLDMPLARNTSTKVPGAPSSVIFTAHLKQDTLLAPGRDLACWADSLGDEARIARIPLASRAPVGDAPATPPAQASSGSDPAAASAAPTDASLSVDALPAADAPPAPAPEPAATDIAPVADSPVVSASPALASAPIPPATASDDTFVPGWILALFVAIVPGAAIGRAVVLRRRLRRLKSQTPALA